MSTDTLELLAGRYSALDLPVAIYVVKRDGNIVGGNSGLQHLLWPNAGCIPSGSNIESLYTNCPDGYRQTILEEADAAARRGEYINNVYVSLMADNGTVIPVAINCRGILSNPGDTSSQVIGYVGCMVDITEAESFRQLLPTGTYELDAEDRIIRMNPAILTALGFEFKDLLGRDVDVIYAEKKRSAQLKKLLIENGSFEKQLVKLVAKNGDTKSFLASAFKKPIHGCEYKGRTGTLVDVTRDEQFHNLMNQIPIGAYVIKYHLDSVGDVLSETIEDCNQNFADIFGFDTVEATRDFNVRTLWEDWNSDASLYDQELKRNYPNAAAAIIRVNSHDQKRRFWAELHGRLVKDEEDKLKWRVGAIRDISGDVSLIKLRQDVDNVFHGYRALLITLRQLLPQIINILGEDLFHGIPSLSAEHYAEPLEEQARQLENLIKKLLDIRSEESFRGEALPDHRWDDLISAHMTLSCLSTIPKDHWDPTLLDLSLALVAIMQETRKGLLPKQITRAVRQGAERLSRTCSQILIKLTLDRGYDMEMEIDLFRQHLISPSVEPSLLPEKATHSINYLIGKVIESIGLYPRIRGVSLRQRLDDQDAMIRGNEKHLVAAFYNLLHNAVKYSWERELGERPWVLIRCRVGNHRVAVHFENYGVPIRDEEIVSGSIFDPGSRGSESTDRGRTGMGVGLWWARRVARQYGGDVTITSRPAAPGIQPNDYSVPFITVAAITLPRIL